MRASSAFFSSSICIPRGPLKRVASPGGWDTNDEWRVGSKVTVYRFRRLDIFHYRFHLAIGMFRLCIEIYEQF